LGGDLRPVRGVLASALAARRAGARTLLVPSANLGEAALVPDLATAGAGSLAQVSEWLRGVSTLQPPGPPRAAPAAVVEDLADVRGQPLARRALEIAAAGGHNLLLVGPPGAGKTMLARRLVGLLPDLGRDEALEATQVLSAAGQLGADAGLVTARPFRAPHHTVSVAGLVGGGSRVPRPGEVSLAHASLRESPWTAQIRRKALIGYWRFSSSATTAASRSRLRAHGQAALVEAAGVLEVALVGQNGGEVVEAWAVVG
jgi:magnesium chelatase family protein